MKRFALLAAAFLSSNAFAASPVVVELFHDDGHCDDANFITKVEFTGTPGIDLKLCKFVAVNSDANSVWGIRLNGSCRDVTDTSVASMCDRISQAIETGTRL